MVLMLDSRRRGGTAALRMGVASGYTAVQREHTQWSCLAADTWKEMWGE